MEFGILCVGVMVGIMLFIAWIADQIDKSKTRKFTSSDSSEHGGSTVPNNVHNYGYPKIYSGNDFGRPDITSLGINEIKACGLFTPAERAAEYRRRRKSPSGVIDGVYNDAYRGNGSYNDSYRDWDADA